MSQLEQQALALEAFQQYQGGLVNLGGLIRRLSEIEGFPIMVRWGIPDIQLAAQASGRELSEVAAEQVLGTVQRHMENQLDQVGAERLCDLVARYA